MIASLGTPETRRAVASLIDAYVNRHKLWQPLDVVSVTAASGASTSFARQADDSWFVFGERPEQDTFIVTAQVKARDIQAIRLEAMPDDRLPGKGPGRYDPSGNFHLTEFRARPNRQMANTNGAASARVFEGIRRPWRP